VAILSVLLACGQGEGLGRDLPLRGRKGRFTTEFHRDPLRGSRRGALFSQAFGGQTSSALNFGLVLNSACAE